MLKIKLMTLVLLATSLLLGCAQDKNRKDVLTRGKVSTQPGRKPQPPAEDNSQTTLAGSQTSNQQTVGAANQPAVDTATDIATDAVTAAAADAATHIATDAVTSAAADAIAAASVDAAGATPETSVAGEPVTQSDNAVLADAAAEAQVNKCNIATSDEIATASNGYEQLELCHTVSLPISADGTLDTGTFAQQKFNLDQGDAYLFTRAETILLNRDGSSEPYLDAEGRQLVQTLHSFQWENKKSETVALPLTYKISGASLVYFDQNDIHKKITVKMTFLDSPNTLTTEHFSVEIDSATDEIVIRLLPDSLHLVQGIPDAVIVDYWLKKSVTGT